MDQTVCLDSNVQRNVNYLCAGLYLLGFKARSCLRSWHTWRQSTFVYPDEHSMPGSTTAFIALHEAMLQADRCPHLLACALNNRIIVAGYC